MRLMRKVKDMFPYLEPYDSFQFKRTSFIFKREKIKHAILIYLMISIGLLPLHILETILADPKLGALAIVLGVGREVPGVHLKAANLDPVNIFHLQSKAID